MWPLSGACADASPPVSEFFRVGSIGVVRTAAAVAADVDAEPVAAATLKDPRRLRLIFEPLAIPAPSKFAGGLDEIAGLERSDAESREYADVVVAAVAAPFRFAMAIAAAMPEPTDEASEERWIARGLLMRGVEGTEVTGEEAPEAMEEPFELGCELLFYDTATLAQRPDRNVS